MITYDKTVWQNEVDPPINADNLNKIEDGIGACVEQINANTDRLSNIDLEPVLIWENNDIDVAFEETTIKEFLIDEDLTEYKRFIVLIRVYNTKDIYCEHIVCSKGYKLFLNAGRVDTVDYDAGRCISITDEAITFHNGQISGSIGKASKSYNQYAIPVQIIGYKY